MKAKASKPISLHRRRVTRLIKGGMEESVFPFDQLIKAETLRLNAQRLNRSRTKKRR